MTILRQGDRSFYNILYNVYKHLEDEYDNCFVVVGDTGTGKSHFVLNLIETWYTAILDQKINKHQSKQITGDYFTWVKNFKELKQYDINALDEGNLALDSKDFMTKTSKDISKLFNVFRSKKFFSIIILPDFFMLNKYFRENRLRGLIYIPRRGEYHFYSKNKIKFINLYNYGNKLKRVNVVSPTHKYYFDKYEGQLLRNYEQQKENVINELLHEINSKMQDQKLNANYKSSKVTYKNLIQDSVFQMLDEGKPPHLIKTKLNCDPQTFGKIKKEYMMKKAQYNIKTISKIQKRR